MAHAKSVDFVNLFFPKLDGVKGFFDVVKEDLSFLSENNAPGTAQKQGSFQRIFQLSDGAADSRRTDKKPFGCPGNVPFQGDYIKNTIRRKRLFHTHLE